MWIADVDGGPAELVYTTTMVLPEAPNWAPDGRALLLNGDGLLWRLELDPSAALEHVPLDGLPPINNDHVVDADRRLIYLPPTMASSGSRRSGTAHRRACHDPSRYHFVHGVSPDGKTLAFAEFATYMSFPTGTLDHPADPRGRRATGPHVEPDRADRAVLAVRRSGPVGIGFIGGGTVSDT